MRAVQPPPAIARTLRLAAGLLALAPLAARAAPPALPPESAAQLQKLLAVPAGQTLENFDNHTPPRIPADPFDRLFMWNEIALGTTAIDHTPVPPGSHRIFGEQFGPARSSRAIAIVQIATFEAVNAIVPRFQSYVGLAPVAGPVSMDYAIAQSAHDTLVWLYPSQSPRLDALLAADVAQIKGDPAKLAAGKALGQQAAAAIIALRTNDGSQIPDPQVGGPYTPIGGVGHWSPDPVSNVTLYLGAYWNLVKPFTLASAEQFRAPPPPALADPAYTLAFHTEERIGGDPRFGTPTRRTREQTFNAIFWAYDGTPSLCAPPRMYNQVARAIALQQGMNRVTDAARFLALINTAMADAAISAWDTKWHYQYWRPVTAIRSPEQGGNHHVIPDPDFYPLGGQATNTSGPDFTPPFPSYVSGHATFGGALFEILRHYYPDATPFTFLSDEWNGKNRDVSGRLRPYHPMSYANFHQAEFDNAESRIYLGIHWQFDADQGILEGNKVADWVFGHAFQPLK